MKFKYLLMAVASLGLFASCESDDPSVAIAEYHKPTTFVLNQPQFSNAVYDLMNAEYINLQCSQPDYGYAAAVNYTVEVSNTEDFATAATVAGTFTECNMFVPAYDFSTAICVAKGWASQEEIDAELAAAGGSLPVYIRLNAVIANSVVKDSEITSNVIKINTIPFFALPPMVVPTVIYMTGDFSGWDWGNSAAMTQIHSNESKFWTIRYCEAGKSVKFNISQADDSFLSEAAHVTAHSEVEGVNATVTEDGGVSVDKSGWYLYGVDVAIDGRKYQYDTYIFPPKVYVYGACNGGTWDDTYMTSDWEFAVPDSADGEFVSPALAADGELRLCVHPRTLADDIDWAGAWWHTEFIFFDGKIAFRGTGPDQERVNASAGQVVRLNFVTGDASCK